MANWWNKTLTVYHRNGTAWQRYVCSNCYYGTEKRQVINGLTLSSVNKTICRIPVANNVLLVPGDIVVNGEVSDTLADNDSGNALKKKYAGSCFTVKAVKQNTSIATTAHVYGGESV